MEKITYLKKWRDKLQETIWEREVFLAMKRADPEAKKDSIDALIFNNNQDIKLRDFIDEQIQDSN